MARVVDEGEPTSGARDAAAFGAADEQAPAASTHASTAVAPSVNRWSFRKADGTGRPDDGRWRPYTASVHGVRTRWAARRPSKTILGGKRFSCDLPPRSPTAPTTLV